MRILSRREFGRVAAAVAAAIAVVGEAPAAIADDNQAAFTADWVPEQQHYRLRIPRTSPDSIWYQGGNAPIISVKTSQPLAADRRTVENRGYVFSVRFCAEGYEFRAYRTAAYGDDPCQLGWKVVESTRSHVVLTSTVPPPAVWELWTRGKSPVMLAEIEAVGWSVSMDAEPSWSRSAFGPRRESVVRQATRATWKFEALQALGVPYLMGVIPGLTPPGHTVTVWADGIALELRPPNFPARYVLPGVTVVTAGLHADGLAVEILHTGRAVMLTTCNVWVKDSAVQCV